MYLFSERKLLREERKEDNSLYYESKLEEEQGFNVLSVRKRFIWR